MKRPNLLRVRYLAGLGDQPRRAPYFLIAFFNRARDLFLPVIQLRTFFAAFSPSCRK